MLKCVLCPLGSDLVWQGMDKNGRAPTAQRDEGSPKRLILWKSATKTDRHNLQQLSEMRYTLLLWRHANAAKRINTSSTRVCSNYICYVVALIACTSSTFGNDCILSSFFSCNKVTDSYTDQ
jgi:hypothetical protein